MSRAACVRHHSGLEKSFEVLGNLFSRPARAFALMAICAHLLTTSPSLFTRNLVKFHFRSLVRRPPCLLFRNPKTGSAAEINQKFQPSTLIWNMSESLHMGIAFLPGHSLADNGEAVHMC